METKGIESEVARVDVPLSYADQLYNPRLRIQALQHRLAGIAAAFVEREPTR